MRKIIVLVGPSGSGKTSLANLLIKNGFYKPVTCTTRNKRSGENHGVDYFFLSENEFIKKKDNEELVDFDRIFDTWYGVERNEFEKNDQDVVMPATFQGVINLKKHFDNVKSVFLNPPGEKILIERMKKRFMSDELIEERIKNVRSEILNLEKCDYVISTNQPVEKAYSDLERILC